MNEEVKKKLIAAIDQMFDRLTFDGNRGFRTENDRLAFYYGKNKKRQQRWRSGKPCMYPGCVERSVPRSHTIPRSASLELLSENGHVITPQVRNGRMEAALVGIGEASTFPGFCEEHEHLFASFERRKRLVTYDDVALQTMRAVCREMRVKEEHRRSFEEMRNEHQLLLNERGWQIVEEILGDDFILQHGVSKVVIGDLDGTLRTLEREIADLTAASDEYNSNFLQPLMEELKGNGDHFCALRTTIDARLPVCLSGRANFRIQDAAGVHDVVAMLTVWPVEDDTDVMMVVPNKHEQAARRYRDAFSTPLFKLVSMVESWMIHGSDHWFMTPSAWEAIPKQRQDAILKDILDFSRNIGQEYDGSLFDGLRRQMITTNENDDRPEVQQWLAKEREKLSYVGRL